MPSLLRADFKCRHFFVPPLRAEPLRHPLSFSRRGHFSGAATCERRAPALLNAGTSPRWHLSAPPLVRAAARRALACPRAVPCPSRARVRAAPRLSVRAAPRLSVRAAECQPSIRQNKKQKNRLQFLFKKRVCFAAFCSGERRTLPRKDSAGAYLM